MVKLFGVEIPPAPIDKSGEGKSTKEMIEELESLDKKKIPGDGSLEAKTFDTGLPTGVGVDGPYEYSEIKPEDFFSPEEIKEIGDAIPEEKKEDVKSISYSGVIPEKSIPSFYVVPEIPKNLEKLVNGAAAMFETEVLVHANSMSEEMIKRQMGAIKEFIEKKSEGKGMQDWSPLHANFYDRASKIIDAKIGRGINASKARELKEALEDVFMGLPVAKV